MNHNTREDVSRTVQFLTSIGLEVSLQPKARGFLHHVRIESGVLKYDQAVHPSDLLHEAGHLAILPQQFRSLASDDLSQAFRAMRIWQTQYLDTCGAIDEQQIAKLVNASDPEATAWAWAAGLAIGLDGEQIILDSHYSGAGAVERLKLKSGHHPGIHGLQHAGMCIPRAVAKLRYQEDLAVYPRLSRWLQDEARFQ